MSVIGFIGLGNMGLPMATNLLKANHALKVFDLNPTALDTIRKLGATGRCCTNPGSVGLTFTRNGWNAGSVNF